MKTFPLTSIWFKTVKGTDLEKKINGPEIALILEQAGLIARVGVDRYTITAIANYRTKSEFKSYLLSVIREGIGNVAS